MSEQQCPINKQQFDTFLEGISTHQVKMASIWWQHHKDLWPSDPNEKILPDELIKVLGLCFEGYVKSHHNDYVLLLKSGDPSISPQEKDEYIFQNFEELITSLITNGFVTQPHIFCNENVEG